MQFILNGKKVRVEPNDASQTLNEYLREDVGLTGTKICCGIAVCRVCTVAVQEGSNSSPEPTRSCITPLSTLEGKSVTTVEGLSKGDELHPLQKAFLENFSFQCGYSAPGFLMASYCLLDRLQRNPIPKSEIENVIQDAVGQHVCRCTGYVRYHNAIRQVILETPGLTI
jgi:aerobic-type carbon monoxide dehydrogenase small subunit (CoxS/CutS family)